MKAAARILTLVWLASQASFAEPSQAQLERRKEALDILLKVLPPTRTDITGRISAQDRSWEDWVRRTGELPPDFETLPSISALPDPLLSVEGGKATPIKTPEQWQRQKRWIRSQFEQWITGRMPPAPDNLRARITKSVKEGDLTVEDVLLEFGPGHRARLRVQLIIPPGRGPFPVFLTNHARTRPWVATAVRRGYIGAIYFATDPVYGHGDDSDGFIEVYPEYDFSCLTRWAWAAMRAVDYLYTRPEVDRAKIGITGHSRNGKQALIAAAFDERIGAAVPSCGNTGEGDPWRYTTDMFVNESIQQITGNFPHWFHPRLRFFTGREHKLPVDQNSLMALVAPRGLMLASAFSETQGNAFGFEQAYRSVREVYRFHGAENRLALNLRPGEHATTAEDIERYVDFFDAVFGRRGFPLREEWIHGYDFATWRKLSGDSADLSGRPRITAGRALTGDWRASAAQRIRWLLGEEPAGLPFPAATEIQKSVRTSDGWLAVLYGRPLRIAGVSSAPLAFGDDLKADLYIPVNAEGRPLPGKRPAVVWLHPYAYPTGYSRTIRQTLEDLTRRGFLVAAFDQIGFGTRSEQARLFYERYPKWSLMGKMVADTRAVVDALAALDTVDASRIYLVGHALGGKVALFTAALEEKVAGVAAAAGFTPFRLATAEKGTEGLRHYSHLHGLIPRLGFFLNQEDRIPADYEELLGLIAPRPAYILAPTLDRYANASDVRLVFDSAKRVYRAQGREERLVLDTPVDFNRFTLEMQDRVFDWLERQR